ncbi:MAG: uracil-DNA glycosylase [Clostridia bacterium]|nr:uracil-DNA glycosylase [Clostridia bacterium]
MFDMYILPTNRWSDFFNAPTQHEILARIELNAEKFSLYVIYPPYEAIFKCFFLTDKPDVTVVILGQDPYHNPDQAIGLSFGVPQGIKAPPSLKNIFKELSLEGFCPDTFNTDLATWAKQGVLLLNSILSVSRNNPLSHKDLGWQTLTDNVLIELNNSSSPIVFMLWGAYAQSKKVLVTNPMHLVLCAPHPSPLSAHRGFLGCNHFRLCNEYLTSHDLPAINW